jgi:Fe-S cluster assembly scaffold protein SufB
MNLKRKVSKDMALSQTELGLLRQIADLEKTPQGAYNIRKNGHADSRSSTANISIESKTDKPGIDIKIKDGTKNESVHIPVIVTESGLTDMTYNDFYIGDDCDVLIVAGCGIHNSGCETAQHDGIHTFYIGKNSKLRYVEKHYGEGEGSGERILNPETKVYIGEGSSVTFETTQIKGVDSTNRKTDIFVGKNAEVIITEKLMTHGKQTAHSDMEIILEGEGSNGRVLSRSVATDESVQVFYPKMTGKAECFGHVECDSIIMGNAKISSIPAIVAEHPDSVLVHEAAIGKIAGEQLLKLMTLGLDEKEAEERILKGFLD